MSREIVNCGVCDSGHRNLALKVQGRNVCYSCLDFFKGRALFNGKDLGTQIQEDIEYLNMNEKLTMPRIKLGDIINE